MQFTKVNDKWVDGSGKPVNGTQQMVLNFLYARQCFQIENAKGYPKD